MQGRQPGAKAGASGLSIRTNRNGTNTWFHPPAKCEAVSYPHQRAPAQKPIFIKDTVWHRTTVQ
eukprot:1464271-Pleurochrysis_carterae.AAC.1